MQIIEGGVTAAKGFSAANTAAGIKYKDRDDMAMIASDVPCVVAGTYTKNVVKAAPVIWDRAITRDKGAAQAVVINAGIANACTGTEGMEACQRTAACAAKALDLKADDVLVASTGVIGMQLPVDKLESGIRAMAPQLSKHIDAGHKAARAIMTTDTKPKEAAVTVDIDGVAVTVGGMCKGSGMIHPNMGTMLSFITTDAAITKELLQKALSDTVEDTYNMISVDGDTSTNDTCVVLANGLCGNPVIDREGRDYETFKEALSYVNETLAKKMAGDGEGATALFETKVIGARNKEEAKILAKSVITSNLTKAAIFGHDANWGRILCALGYAGVEFDPEAVDITVTSAAGTISLVKCGVACDYSEEEATKILGEEAVTVICDMKQNDGTACAWGCDLTYDYVKINADYRS
ncbi:MAG: bifunctional glutamate N-acetyltransferase/amino-acid acetyltransferase ArgJ [Lachnospiraceae bacterium]|nr:bifunctional glutamate N-acetyltransferase/amino-acid acetyltransferase ArgJ [Lachnospiraceae bacterium]